ncbi:hypothetical protein GOV06_04415 [Candidatus Woesearchaeota archaeon]|nr:hypothetical protein [Candidatus Woesearchaeota archaeon]
MTALEKLPKEDGLDKAIISIEEKTKHLIEVDCTRDLIFGVENITDWLEAFQEHYNLETGQNHSYWPHDNIMIRGMKIPPSKPGVDFSVDYSHMCLRFRTSRRDEKQRDIVYKFIERLME